MDVPKPGSAEIRTIQLAKVGDKRERKRGAAWLTSRELRYAVTRATSGTLGAGLSLTKVIILALVSAGGSLGLLQMRVFSNAKPAVAGKTASPQVFSVKSSGNSGADAANVPVQNSLGYVFGSKDGLTPAQRAQKADADAAAAKAAQDASMKADQNAAKSDGQDAGAAAPAAASGAAAGGNLQKSMAPGQFGGARSSFGGGGGLTGGSGLAGGIGGGFAAMKSPGAKSQGGNLKGFGGSSHAVTAAAGHRSAASKSNAQGFGMRQLQQSAAGSRQAAAAGTSEAAAAGAATSFDNSRTQSTIVTGPSVQSGIATTNPSTPPTAVMDPGGPLGNNNDVGVCPGNAAPDAEGNCPAAVATPTSKATASYQKDVDQVKKLMNDALILAGVMVALVIAILIAIANEPIGAATLLALKIAYHLCQLAMIVIGAETLILGIKIATESKDAMLGGIIAAAGTAMVLAAAVPALNYIGLLPTLLIGTAATDFAAANVKGPAND